MAIGNKLLVHGYISHVSYEHLFCAKNILYRFHSDIDPLVLLPQTRKRGVLDGSDDEDEEHNMLMNEMSNDAISLTLCQKDLKKAHVTIEKAFKYADNFIELSAIAQNQSRKGLHELHRFKTIFFVFASLVVFSVLLIGVNKYFFQMNPSLTLRWSYHYAIVALVFLSLSVLLLFNVLLRVIKIPNAAVGSENMLHFERQRKRFIDFQRRIRHTVLKCDDSDSDDSCVPDEEDDLHYENFINKLHDEGEEAVSSNLTQPSAKDEGIYPSLSISLSAEDHFDNDENDSNNADDYSDENPIFTDDDSEDNSKPTAVTAISRLDRRKHESYQTSAVSRSKKT